MPITHSKTCARPDGPDSSQILSSDWNADHDGGTLADVLAAGNDPDGHLIQAANFPDGGLGAFLELSAGEDTVGGQASIKANDFTGSGNGNGGSLELDGGKGKSGAGDQPGGGAIAANGGDESGDGGSVDISGGGAKIATGGATGGSIYLSAGPGILDGNSTNAAAIAVGGGKANGDPGVVHVYSDGVSFDLKQAAHVSDGSTVDQLRDALIAAGLMAAS
jgi:hypothetical protein